MGFHCQTGGHTMTRFTVWIVKNLDGLFAVFVAALVAVLGLLDVLNADATNNAVLLVLAVLAAAVLRDRARSENADSEVHELLRRAGPVLDDLPAALARLEGLDTAVTHTRQALEENSMVRVLTGREISNALAEARRNTDRWLFKGGTGTYLRAVTLPECVTNAQRDKRALLVRLEIIDPTNETVCTEYAGFRRALSDRPDGTGETWTTERVRRESFATVLAACWYRQRFGLLDIDLGLSSTMTTFRWDVSSSAVIITQEDHGAPAMMIERGKLYYDRYSTELLTSLEQAKRVPIEQSKLVRLSDEPTVEEVQRLFTKLALPFPSTFTDHAVADVIRRALRAKNPYQ